MVHHSIAIKNFMHLRSSHTHVQVDKLDYVGHIPESYEYFSTSPELLPRKLGPTPW